MSPLAGLGGRVTGLDAQQLRAELSIGPAHPACSATTCAVRRELVIARASSVMRSVGLAGRQHLVVGHQLAPSTRCSAHSFWIRSACSSSTLTK